MGRYGVNGDARVVLSRVHRVSSQCLLQSGAAKRAGGLAPLGLQNSLGPTPSPGVSRWPWFARERLN